MSPHRSSKEWQQALAHQAAVIELGQLGLRGASVDELVAAAVGAVSKELDCPHVVLFEVVEDRDELRGRAVIYRNGVTPAELAAQVRVPGGAGSLPGYTVQAGEPIAADDLLGDPRFTAQAPALRIPAVSAIAAPIVWDDGNWGALCAYSEVPRAWSDDEVLFMSSVGATIGLSLLRERVERTLRESAARLDLAIDAGGLGVWSWEVAGDQLHFNARAREIYGIPEDEPADSGAYHLSLVHPEDLPRILDEAAVRMQPGAEQHQVFRIRRPADGASRWIESWGRVLADEAGALRLVGVSADITERRAAEERREALLAAERDARLMSETVRERLSILGEASEAFAQSLDPKVVAASLVACCVPRIADACLVDLFDDRGVLEEAAGGALDADALRDVREIRRRRREAEAERVWAGERVLSGAGHVAVERITRGQLEAAAVDQEHLALLMRFAAEAAIVVPLMARGETIGTLTLIGNSGRDAFDDDQRALIHELASRAALALDNSRLFASRNRVARSLQDALLPPVLPSLPGLDLAARYQVAEHDIEIGGDFYDVMEMPGGAWGIVLGDVCGRGPDAAALTGLIRHSVRAAAVREREPSGVLGQTNAAVLDQIDDSRFCTATFVRVDLDGVRPGSVRAVTANAGHPRPMLRRADGTVEILSGGGSLLGVIDHPNLIDVEHELAPGDALVLYTDGVTEARSGLELFGEERLAATLAALDGTSAESLAAGIEAAVTGFRDGADDDLAVVVLLALDPTG